MNLGCHISIANGIDLIFERAEKVTANAIQIFVTNQNQWATRQPKQEELERYFKNREQFSPFAIIAHSRYLINLCSSDKDKEDKSMIAFSAELELCEKLNIPYLVLHPGSHLGEGEEWGLIKIVQNLDVVFSQFPNLQTKVLLENTAGQGTNLGYRFQQLKFLFENSRYPENLGVCFDTCHAFASGYNLIDDYDEVFANFNELIGLEQIKAFHLNDTKKGLSSKVDRHEHIGKGELGIKPFARLLNDKRFEKVPMILETPKGDNDEMDIVNLKTLRDLRT